MREVVCKFDNYVYAALEAKAEALGNSVENIIEFAVVEAVTGHEVGDHVEEANNITRCSNGGKFASVRN